MTESQLCRAVEFLNKQQDSIERKDMNTKLPSAKELFLTMVQRQGIDCERNDLGLTPDIERTKEIWRLCVEVAEVITKIDSQPEAKP